LIDLAVDIFIGNVYLLCVKSEVGLYASISLCVCYCRLCYIIENCALFKPWRE